MFSKFVRFNIIVSLIVILVLISMVGTVYAGPKPLKWGYRPVARGNHFAVVSNNPLATMAGEDILRKGFFLKARPKAMVLAALIDPKAKAFLFRSSPPLEFTIRTPFLSTFFLNLSKEGLFMMMARLAFLNIGEAMSSALNLTRQWAVPPRISEP